MQWSTSNTSVMYGTEYSLLTYSGVFGDYPLESMDNVVCVAVHLSEGKHTYFLTTHNNNRGKVLI